MNEEKMMLKGELQLARRLQKKNCNNDLVVAVKGGLHLKARFRTVNSMVFLAPTRKVDMRCTSIRLLMLAVKTEVKSLGLRCSELHQQAKLCREEYPLARW